MSSREVVIVDSVRTGLAKSFRGSFNLTRPDDMAAHCIRALLERTKLDPALIEDCIVGTGFPEGPQGMNLGRIVAIRAGLPVSVPGVTLNRFCSSGLNTIAVAAQQILAGGAEVIVAGGTESITMLQNDVNMKNLPNPAVFNEKPGIYFPMGQTAEVVAKRYKVSRQSQDEMALASQQRTAKAQEAGLFKDEIVPMKATYEKVDKASGQTSQVEALVDRDECNRPDTTLEGLAKLKPVFDPAEGSVTAGNSSQMSDGASMTLVMSAERAKQLGLKPIGIYRQFVVAGCEPDEMGIGPVFAIPKLLKLTGVKQDDIDLIELNEAFASQAVYCRDKLGLDPEKLNVNGGSIAIGHPYGMTGSRLTGHLLRELARRNKRYGIVSMCIGGGQGAAGLFERV
ncbi:MAG TPA: thiolase family protein [Polyangiaceae bacterium]